MGAVHYDLYFFPGDLADARFNNYLLEHGYRYLTGQDSAFWQADFMYPEPEVISYSDNLMGTVPFYAFFRLFGADRETAFQLWYLLMVVLNFTSAFLFLRYLVKNNKAAVLGAFVYAFSMALHSQLVHAQTFPRFMVPLCLWAALVFQKELRPRYLFLAVLAWVYQMYCGIYLGFMLLVPMLCIIIASFYTRWSLYKLKFKSSRWITLISAGILTNGLLLLPLMIPYLARSAKTGLYAYEQVIKSLPTLASFFYSRHGSVFWQFNQDLCVQYENFWDFILFPGGIALVAFAVVGSMTVFAIMARKRAFFAEFDSTIRLFFVCAVVVCLLYLRFGDFSLYRLIFHIPGFGSMRALQRIVNIELLFFGAAVAVLFAKLFQKKAEHGWLFYTLASTVLLADNFIKHDYFDKTLKAESQGRVNEIIQKIGDNTKKQVLSYEPDTVIKHQIYFQLDAMLAAQSLGIKTLNGYSATSPVGYDAYWRRPEAISRRIWIHHMKIDSTDVMVVR